jgi:hypothetical protein
MKSYLNKIPNAYQVERVMSALNEARQKLIANDSDAEEFMSGIHGDIEQILVGALRGSVDMRDLAKSAHERMVIIREREARFSARADALRRMAFDIMDIIGERKVTLPDITAYVTNGRATVVITDSNVIPDEYVRIIREPNKTSLAEAMAVGEVIAGAEMQNGNPYLTIRTK